MGNRVTIRGTTFMPNIHGLPALLTLIFAPRVEFRSNEGRTRLNGAICGLGYDARLDQAVCPERDMEIAFDKEIDYEVRLNLLFFLSYPIIYIYQSIHQSLGCPEREQDSFLAQYCARCSVVHGSTAGSVQGTNPRGIVSFYSLPKPTSHLDF